jgi:GTP cyclohydrolase I
MFVEDLVREVAVNLKRIKGISWARIEAENWESIHNHSAYAFLERIYS